MRYFIVLSPNRVPHLTFMPRRGKEDEEEEEDDDDDKPNDDEGAQHQ